MIEPTEADIGRGVIYRDYGFTNGQRREKPLREERGVISSFNQHYVFVRYGNGSTAAATWRDDLFWEHEGEKGGAR